MKLSELLEQATPLPWRSARSHEDQDGPMFDLEPGETKPITRIYGSNGKLVATAHDLFEFKEADAVLLTHAVNMLPKLVGALQGVVSSGFYGNSTGYQHVDVKVIEVVKAVLAEANNPEVSKP